MRSSQNFDLRQKRGPFDKAVLEQLCGALSLLLEVQTAHFVWDGRRYVKPINLLLDHRPDIGHYTVVVCPQLLDAFLMEAIPPADAEHLAVKDSALDARLKEMFSCVDAVGCGSGTRICIQSFWRGRDQLPASLDCLISVGLKRPCWCYCKRLCW